MSNNIKYKIKEIRPKVFLAEFEDRYDMCMTFLRYQEFYESPNQKFRNKSFTILDFMEWYSKKQSKHGCFTYCEDWIGFNFFSCVLKKCQANILDFNKYDQIMSDITKKISYLYRNKNGSSTEERYYLIGALKGNERTVKHEVAHAFFYLNKSYKKEMLALVKKLNPKFRTELYKSLIKIGYTKQVLPDEAQAFLSTGWREYFPKLKNQDKPFIEVFNKYYNGK